jgi:hypothetical protein
MSTTITSVAKKRKADEGEVFTLTVSVWMWMQFFFFFYQVCGWQNCETVQSRCLLFSPFKVASKKDLWNWQIVCCCFCLFARCMVARPTRCCAIKIFIVQSYLEVHQRKNCEIDRFFFHQVRGRDNYETICYQDFHCLVYLGVHQRKICEIDRLCFLPGVVTKLWDCYQVCSLFNPFLGELKIWI